MCRGVAGVSRCLKGQQVTLPPDCRLRRLILSAGAPWKTLPPTGVGFPGSVLPSAPALTASLSCSPSARPAMSSHREPLSWHRDALPEPGPRSAPDNRVPLDTHLTPPISALGQDLPKVGKHLGPEGTRPTPAQQFRPPCPSSNNRVKHSLPQVPRSF